MHVNDQHTVLFLPNFYIRGLFLSGYWHLGNCLRDGYKLGADKRAPETFIQLISCISNHKQGVST